MKPQIVRNVKQFIIDNKTQSAKYHDRKCIKETTFGPGEQIFVKLSDQPKQKWLPGYVRNQIKSRSYDVSVCGRNYRRNSLHIKSAHNRNYNQPLHINSKVTKGQIRGEIL
jgi:hypothetical protein